MFVSGGAALEGAWHTAGGQSLLDRRIRTEDKEYYSDWDPACFKLFISHLPCTTDCLFVKWEEEEKEFQKSENDY